MVILTAHTSYPSVFFLSSPACYLPFHSSYVLETIKASKSNSVWNDGTTINHSILSSMPVLPPPLFSHHHPPPVVPHFNSSSVSEPINTSPPSSPPNEPHPSSMQVLPPPLCSHPSTQVVPPLLCSHHSTQVLPPLLRSYHRPPSIIPPFYTAKDGTSFPSTSNSNLSSNHTPTTVGHPYSYMNRQPEIRSLHPPLGIERSMNSLTSIHSRACSSNSILP